MQSAYVFRQMVCCSNTKLNNSCHIYQGASYQRAVTLCFVMYSAASGKPTFMAKRRVKHNAFSRFSTLLKLSLKMLSATTFKYFLLCSQLKCFLQRGIKIYFLFPVFPTASLTENTCNVTEFQPSFDAMA